MAPARRRPRRNRRLGFRRVRGGRRRARRSPRPSLLWLLGGLLAVVVGINGAIRACGGGASFLSLRYLPEKVHALAAFACHVPRHVWSDPHPPAEAALARAAGQVGVPAALAVSMARAESGLDPHVISATGAMGLMQLMPDTAREQGVGDPFDTVQSAEGGTRYLAGLWRRYRGDRHRTVAAYNAGPGRVPRSGRLVGLPGETRAYMRRVLAGR